MESEKYFHKNRCGVVTARLSFEADEEAAALEFTKQHKASVIAAFEEETAIGADLAYDKKRLKFPVCFEISYRFENGKKPCLSISETVRSGRKVILERGEKHLFKRRGKGLYYRGISPAGRPNKMNILHRNT